MRDQFSEIVEGRMKVIDPLMSTGTSVRVAVLQRSGSEIRFRGPRALIVGASVHLRISQQIFIGEVEESRPIATEHEVRMRIKEAIA
jgi:hypothetical protein